MIESLHRFRRAIGMDRAVFFTAAARGWSLISAIVTIKIVGTHLSEQAQGFYVTFGGIIALYSLLELGLSQSLIQTASHEFAHLSLGPKGEILGDAAAKNRLCAVGKLSLRWYGCIALLIIGLIAPAGHAFFASQSISGIDWILPWWSFCALAAVNVTLMPVLFLLEGCGRIASINAFRFYSGIVGTIAIWITLKLGGGLYACTAQIGVLVIGGAYFLSARWAGFLRDLFAAKAIPARDYLAEVWRFQWRIAVSWASGYFAFSAINPLLFHFQGPVAAGQVGLTMQALNGIVALAASWTSTKAPRFGTLIAAGNFRELDALFNRAILQSTGIALLGSVCLISIIALLKAYHPLGTRFVDISGVAFFCIGGVANQATAGLAVYLRAHKQEPFMVISVVAACAIVAGSIGFGWLRGTTGAAFGYFFATTLISLPAAIFVFRRKKTEWHQAK